LPLVAFLAVALVVFARLLVNPTGLIVDPDRPSIDHANRAEPRPVGNDLTFLFLPHHLSIIETISHHGHLPLWDARGFGGRPMVGNPQGGLFYPPVWLFWLSASPATPGWITVAHLLWGGLGVFVLSRAQQVSRFAATIAGGVYLASPLLLAHTFEGHYPHVWGACWYPWAFWAYQKFQRGQASGTVFLPICLALCYLSGHPQEWYLLMLALATRAIADIGRLARSGGVRIAVRFAIPFAVLVALSLGLGGVDLVPQMFVRPWLLGADPTAPPVPIPASYQLRLMSVLQLFSPFALGGPPDYFGADNYWETVCSIGLIPLILVLISVCRHTDRRAVYGWLCLLAVAMWFACGRQLFLFPLLYKTLPGMSAFRVPGRTLFLANLAAAVLAGMGVEHLRTRSINPSRDQRFLRVPATLVGMLALFELALYGFVLIQVSPAERFLTPARKGDAIARLIADTREAESTNTLPSIRIKARDHVFGDLAAMRAGFEKVNLNDVFQIGHAALLYEPLYTIASRERPFLRLLPASCPLEEFDRHVRQSVLDRMGVMFLISDRVESDPPWPVVVNAGPEEPLVIQHNPTALPRAYVVPRARVEPENSRTALALIRATDPRQKVLMASDPLDGIEPERRATFQPVCWTSLDPDHPQLEVTTSAPGLLVVADTWMPGWTATDNGKPVPILRGNFAQRVIPLATAGRHRIQMDYWPPGLTAGLTLTGASMIAWLALAAAAFARQARPQTRRQLRSRSVRWTLRADHPERRQSPHRSPARLPSDDNGQRQRSIPPA
jgi:hypothetical protein